MDFYSNFERMEMSRGSVGSLKFQKIFTNPLGFSNITFYCLGAELMIWWSATKLNLLPL